MAESWQLYLLNLYIINIQLIVEIGSNPSLSAELFEAPEQSGAFLFYSGLNFGDEHRRRFNYCR